MGSAAVRERTPAHTIFVTGDRPNNPVAGLAGRSVVMSYRGWLWTYGIDYSRREQDLATGIDAALCTLAEPGQRERLRQSCRRWASGFTWDRTALRLAELVRTDGPRQRVAPVSDAATVVVLEANTGLDRLRERLHASDLWAVEGRTLRVLFQGEDSQGAIAALERLGLSGTAEVRVARVPDLLFGPSGSG